jgi:hypothetical protein
MPDGLERGVPNARHRIGRLAMKGDFMSVQNFVRAFALGRAAALPNTCGCHGDFEHARSLQERRGVDARSRRWTDRLTHQGSIVGRQRFPAHVAILDRVLIVLLHQQGAIQASNRRFVWKEVDHVRASSEHLLVSPFSRRARADVDGCCADVGHPGQCRLDA